MTGHFNSRVRNCQDSAKNEERLASVEEVMRKHVRIHTPELQEQSRKKINSKSPVTNGQVRRLRIRNNNNTSQSTN